MYVDKFCFCVHVLVKSRKPPAQRAQPSVDCEPMVIDRDAEQSMTSTTSICVPGSKQLLSDHTYAVMDSLHKLKRMLDSSTDKPVSVNKKTESSTSASKAIEDSKNLCGA